MFDARRRSAEPEWMDGADTTPSDMAACLRDLAAVNTVTLARAPTLAFMRRAARRNPGRLRVLDVGCGDGDMLRRLHRWAARSGRALELAGLDLNPRCIAAARAATDPALGIEFHEGDAFGDWPGEFDIVLSALFTHHLSDGQIVQFLRLMEARAGAGWLVNDLHRHAIAYHGFSALAAAAGWHRFVRHDGPVSVARSFQRADWTRLLGAAGGGVGMRGVEVRWHLPFRYCVARLR